MTHSRHSPTPRKLRYLKDLALQRGQSFAYPRTAAEAFAEIRRLQRQEPQTKIERDHDRKAITREINELGARSYAIQDDEITSYASECRWANGGSGGHEWSPPLAHRVERFAAV